MAFSPPRSSVATASSPLAAVSSAIWPVLPRQSSVAASASSRFRPRYLAQVDSSVGGKTGINSRHGKNLIGSFHQPAAVFADTALLETLPRRELAAGYAEVAKYGALGDAAFFDWLEAECRRSLRR